MGCAIQQNMDKLSRMDHSTQAGSKGLLAKFGVAGTARPSKICAKKNLEEEEDEEKT